MSENVVELVQPVTTKIKQSKVLTKEFMDSFKKLSICPTISGELIYKVKKEYRKAKDSNSLYEEIRLDLIKSFGKKDENGEPVEVDGFFRVLPENVAAYNKKIKEVDDIEISFNQFSFSKDLKSQGLLPFDLDQLDFIVE